MYIFHIARPQDVINKMIQNNLKLVDECLRSARITDVLCANSVIKYRESLKRFFKSVDGKSFDSLEMRDFDDYILKAKERGNSNSGILSALYAVKWVMKKLQDQKLIKKRIDLEKINKPRVKKKDVNYLTKEEVSKVLGIIERELADGETIRKVRTMALYVLLLETGARINEALSIKINDIDFENREIPIIGKGNKPRTLFLHDGSVNWIKKYLNKRKDDNEFLFVTLNGKEQWVYNNVDRSFLRYRKMANLYKDFTIHTFRHTFATQLLLNGVPINTVSYLLGHANLETTIKYYIGAIKKAEAKAQVLDKHFDFMPRSVLEPG